MIIWVTAYGFVNGNKVYKSIDGGTTWTNISGSLPNVPTDCIIYQHNTGDRLYLGTDIGVYTRDSSDTDWQPFNVGLPNVIANDLAIQYSTNKLFVASFGRGIWVSDLATSTAKALTLIAPDGGEYWRIGQTNQISWLNNGVDDINIQYSTNHGQVWYSIASNVNADLGSYNWVIPNTPSSSCLLKIISVHDSTTFDISSQTFAISSLSSAVKDDDKLPVDYKLSQNYPNPFNPVTQINFSVPKLSQVKIKVFDLLGKEKVVLVDELKSPGNYSVRFSGANFISSVYFYRMEARSWDNNGASKLFSETRKLLLVK
jgi:hypothetical protein